MHILDYVEVGGMQTGHISRHTSGSITGLGTSNG
jgi:hypothetical protein